MDVHFRANLTLTAGVRVCMMHVCMGVCMCVLMYVRERERVYENKLFIFSPCISRVNNNTIMTSEQRRSSGSELVHRLFDSNEESRRFCNLESDNAAAVDIRLISRLPRVMLEIEIW